MRILIVVLILLAALSFYWNSIEEPDQEKGSQSIRVLNEAEQFSEDYDRALDDKRRRIDTQTDG